MPESDEMLRLDPILLREEALSSSLHAKEGALIRFGSYVPRPRYQPRACDLFPFRAQIPYRASRRRSKTASR